MTIPPIEISKLREIAWSLWDPIQLLPIGKNRTDDACRDFADEYDKYLIAAAGLLREGRTDDEITHYLIDIEANQMGLAARHDTASRAQAVVNALRREDGMLTSPLARIPGGDILLQWFGRVPGFHDANLLELNFPGKASGLMRIHAWNMTNELDANGYFILEKHAVVTLKFEGVSAIECVDYDMIPGIIFDLDITEVDDRFIVEWSASYGVTGSITAKTMQISLAPCKPA